MDKRYCVYCHTNKYNGKKYVGMTCQKPEQRWRNGTRYTENRDFTKDILEYGWHNFIHEILYTNLSKEQAEEIERKLITEYRSNDSEYGYNIDSGGIFGTKFSESHKTNISKGKKGKSFSSEHRKNLSESHKGLFNIGGKRVLCIDTKVIYESVNEAERQTGISSKNISAVCLGKRNIAGGYHWIYVEVIPSNG